VRSFCRATFTGLLEDHLKEKEGKQAQVEHSKYECDGCGVFPIKGIRYKCSVRPDYDLCEKCEASGKHSEHPMLKIRKPEHAPIGIMCQYRPKGSTDLANPYMAAATNAQAKASEAAQIAKAKAASLLEQAKAMAPTVASCKEQFGYAMADFQKHTHYDQVKAKAPSVEQVTAMAPTVAGCKEQIGYAVSDVKKHAH